MVFQQKLQNKMHSAVTQVIMPHHKHPLVGSQIYTLIMVPSVADSGWYAHSQC